MADKYTPEELKTVKSALEKLWLHMRRNWSVGSYEKIAPKVRAQKATVWRWHNGKSIPSRWHYYNIRKFLGYGDRW